MTILEDTHVRYSAPAPRSGVAPKIASRSQTGSGSQPRRPSSTANRRFANVRLMQKLLAGFGLVALILALIGGMSIRSQASMETSAQSLYKDGLVATMSLDNYNKHLLNAQFATVRYAFADSAEPHGGLIAHRGSCLHI